jgi:hypothetical protein
MPPTRHRRGESDLRQTFGQGGLDRQEKNTEGAHQREILGLERAGCSLGLLHIPRCEEEDLLQLLVAIEVRLMHPTNVLADPRSNSREPARRVERHLPLPTTSRLPRGEPTQRLDGCQVAVADSAQSVRKRPKSPS